MRLAIVLPFILSFTLHIFGQNAVPNLPLFEEFTSSTCPPCAYYNSTTINPFISDHNNEITVIKYQMNWPGTGDPYYNQEGGVRRSLYGVNSVPSLLAGGRNISISPQGMLNALTGEKNKKSPLFITASHNINFLTKTIDIEINITPYISNNNYRTYIAVLEKTTTNNKATNGETLFYSVMMKMIPDAGGIVMNFTENVPVNLTRSANLSGTKIEQFSDLSVVVFVQNSVTREIIQSAYSRPVVVDHSGSVSGMLPTEIYPNPFTDKLTIEVYLSGQKNLSVWVISPDGRLVRSLAESNDIKSGRQRFEWDGTDNGGHLVSRGLYILKARSEKEEFTGKIIFSR